MENINLSQLSKEFNYRHDFNSSELDVLKKNFPNISFGDIPEAWICLLDEYLVINYKNVTSMYQQYGLLIVEGDVSKQSISKLEKKLYAADFDLHEALGCSSVQN